MGITRVGAAGSTLASAPPPPPTGSLSHGGTTSRPPLTTVHTQPRGSVGYGRYAPTRLKKQPRIASRSLTNHQFDSDGDEEQEDDGSSISSSRNGGFTSFSIRDSVGYGSPPPAPASLPFSLLPQNAEGSQWGRRPEQHRPRYLHHAMAHLCQFLSVTGRLTLFHVLNALLGVAACGVCGGGLITSLWLLPLCGLGVVIFRLVLMAVYGIAQLDVSLSNLLVPRAQRLRANALFSINALAFSGDRLASLVAAPSPLAMRTLVYFASVKGVVSVLSAIGFGLTITGPISLLAAVFHMEPATTAAATADEGDDDDAWLSYRLEDLVSYRTNPTLFLLLCTTVFVVGGLVMRLVARVSRMATQFFCCEPAALRRSFVPLPDHDVDHFHQHERRDNTTSLQGPAARYGAVVVTTNNGSHAAS